MNEIFRNPNTSNQIHHSITIASTMINLEDYVQSDQNNLIWRFQLLLIRLRLILRAQSPICNQVQAMELIYPTTCNRIATNRFISNQSLLLGSKQYDWPSRPLAIWLKQFDQRLWLRAIRLIQNKYASKTSQKRLKIFLIFTEASNRKKIILIQLRKIKYVNSIEFSWLQVIVKVNRISCNPITKNQIR